MSRARHAKGGKIKGDIGTAPGVMDADSEPASRTVTAGNKVIAQAEEKTIGNVSGKKSAPRMDRPARKMGGKISPMSDSQSRNPMSLAAKAKGGKC